jgi:Zn-dependent protease with chaperone function
VGDLSDEQRQALLEEGFLVPNERQLQFIFGHELAHLRHRHTFETSKIAVLIALLTHFALKMNNAVAHRSKFKFMEIRSTPVYAALVLGLSAAVVAALSWDQELQADVTSARSLNVESEAIKLKQQQLIQNGALKRMGRIDTLDLEHPPPGLQLLNLKWLAASMKNNKT